MRDKVGSSKTSLQSLLIIQVRNNSGLDHGGSKWGEKTSKILDIFWNERVSKFTGARNLKSSEKKKEENPRQPQEFYPEHLEEHSSYL